MRFRRNEEPTTAQEIAWAEERLRILAALAQCLGQPMRVMEVLGASSDVDDAFLRLQAEFGLDRLQAQAVTDMQFRRVIPSELEKVRAQVVEVEDRLRSLRDSESPGPRETE